MHKTVIGNWKMHGSRAEGHHLVSGIAEYLAENENDNVKTVLCPPSTLLCELSGYDGDTLYYGGQDCRVEEQGAYTGDISAKMLDDCGASYVILGHSERRAGHSETNELVASKSNSAKAAGLVPVICIGETLEERESGAFETVLAKQIQQSVPDSFTAQDFLLAYEPVWAIGTGKVADEATIRATHGFIASKLPEGTAILYGGSVKPDNAASIMQIAHVDGVLVGGASLKVESFTAIIGAAAQTQQEGQAA